MSRRDVLNAFKSIHRVAQKTFEGDKRALLEARNRINLEFRQETSEVEEKINRCKEVERILLTQVVQAVKNPETNNYELKLRKETAKLDNVIFKEDAILPPSRNKKCKPDSNS